MRGVTIAKDVDPKVLARGTPGFSGADLQNMVNQAAVQASKLRAKEVDLAHFEWAKDRIIMGVERKSHYIDPETKLSTAYHEGGHALVALYTDGAMPLHKVTCVPRGHALGITSQLPKDDGYSVSYKQYLSTIDVCMGGRVAEELIYGKENISSGASSDIQKATKTAESMVKYWGFSKLGPVFHGDSNGSMSPRKKEEIEEEVSSLVRGGEARATALLTSKMTELHRLAHALVEHETLNLEEVKKVIEGEPLRTIGEILEDGDI
jgi:ATP-dependent metalloprotease